MNKIFLKLSFLAVLAAFLGLSSVALADIERFNVDDIKKLEAIDFLPVEEFDAKTQKIIKNPYDDPDLNYEVNVPNEWLENSSKLNVNSQEGSLNEDVLTEIYRYVGLPHHEYSRSYLSVSAINLPYEIGVKNWFINYLLINGLSLEQLTVKNKRELEALYVEVKKDETYVVRARVLINGSNAVAKSIDNLK